jgi:hypothetical protein
MFLIRAQSSIEAQHVADAIGLHRHEWRRMGDSGHDWKGLHRPKVLVTDCMKDRPPPAFSMLLRATGGLVEYVHCHHH